MKTITSVQFALRKLLWSSIGVIGVSCWLSGLNMQKLPLWAITIFVVGAVLAILNITDFFFQALMGEKWRGVIIKDKLNEEDKR